MLVECGQQVCGSALGLFVIELKRCYRIGEGDAVAILLEAISTGVPDFLQAGVSEGAKKMVA